MSITELQETHLYTLHFEIIDNDKPDNSKSAGAYPGAATQAIGLPGRWRLLMDDN
ncbi:hypothetical protein [Citrobacter braakii]|uniref:hypothetical protein n=1 Tax=Citrobacter braakii TaxID=57706 RepID=UPI0020003D71|nr:hypothetical protein [Citrobacter braakii]MCK2155684.1 hypothetical protein [Citrobacter braakii]